MAGDVVLHWADGSIAAVITPREGERVRFGYECLRVDGLHARAMVRLRGDCPHAWDWASERCIVCRVGREDLA